MANFTGSDFDITFSSPSIQSFESVQSDESVEVGRGGVGTRPSFLFPPISPPPPQEFDRSVELPSRLIHIGHFGGFRFEQPIEERRTQPGCGINPYALFDSPVGAEVVPVQPQPATFDHENVEDLFNQFDREPGLRGHLGRVNFVERHFQTKQYHGPKVDQPRPKFRPNFDFPKSDTYVLSGSSVGQGRPHYLMRPLSPLSSSSSSSSPFSSPGSTQNFQPLCASTFLHTPTQPRLSSTRIRQRAAQRREDRFATPSPEAMNPSSESYFGDESYLSESPIPGQNDSPWSSTGTLMNLPDQSGGSSN